MGDGEFSEPMDDNGADKINMSLDQIIKLNKKEQEAVRGVNRARSRCVTKRNNVLNQTPQAQGGPRQGLLQYQGSIRSHGLNRSRGLGKSSLSPFNRANTKTGEQQIECTTSSSFHGRGRGRGQEGLSRGALPLRVQRVPKRGGKTFVLDRGLIPAIRGTDKLKRYHKIISQRIPSISRTTLTVSLPNAKSPPVSWVKGRPSVAVSSGPPPKGIPLRFNYKAVTNQTQLSLNERFTSLRLRGQGPRSNKESGRGRGWGQRKEISAGRGQGRGVINKGLNVAGGGRARGRARGSCRTVFLQ